MTSGQKQTAWFQTNIWLCTGGSLVQAAWPLGQRLEQSLGCSPLGVLLRLMGPIISMMARTKGDFV